MKKAVDKTITQDPALAAPFFLEAADIPSKHRRLPSFIQIVQRLHSRTLLNSWGGIPIGPLYPTTPTQRHTV